jgi:uroporphyrinogen III methyltransferase/synthase
MKSPGTVYLVGAGPGDAGLLTMRGAELLGRADVVVYDALVNAELLRLAPKSAEILYGGKRARDHALPQEELNRVLISKAREGKTVVRLKGGDPYVFGRGGEEAESLAEAGIPFEVIPGISSVTAAPNYAGIPVTHRDHCSSYMVITGHEDPGKTETALDYAALARTPGTKLILMGVERIGEIAQALVREGMEATTPVAMVRWGTTGRQQTIQGTLATIASVVEQTKFSAPAVTIVGSVVGLRDKLNWFEHRPLFGRRIVVTRTREQASQLSQRLRERGAEVLELPTIRIQPPDDPTALIEALQALGEYDWLIFTSPNGVSAFFDYFFKAYDDVRALGNLRIAAVGPATAAKLKELHLRVDVMPGQYVAKKIGSALTEYESVENLRVLIARAQVADPDLPKHLEALGAIVDDVPLYKTVPETEDPTGAAARLVESGADWITFTSSSTVENFHARFPLPELLRKYPAIRLASIGPETSKAILALGLEPALEAKPHTIDGLISALLNANAKTSRAGAADK